VTGYHPEAWQPSWSIKTILVALRAFLSTPGNGAVGALDYSDAEKKRLAGKSRAW